MTGIERLLRKQSVFCRAEYNLAVAIRSRQKTANIYILFLAIRSLSVYNNSRN